MKVYVVIESWWDGRAFTTNSEEVFVYATEELAIDHKEQFQRQIKEGDVKIQIACKEIMTKDE